MMQWILVQPATRAHRMNTMTATLLAWGEEWSHRKAPGNRNLTADNLRFGDTQCTDLITYIPGQLPDCESQSRIDQPQQVESPNDEPGQPGKPAKQSSTFCLLGATARAHVLNAADTDMSE